MVDIHCHVLFSVDDGCKDLKSSLKLLKEGESLGVKKIILTSHFIKGKYENENYEKNFLKLKDAILKEKIDVEIYRGNEVYLDESIDIILNEKKFNTLNGSRYLLVEFSIFTLGKVGEVLLKKVLEKGYIPVLAHVERYEKIGVMELLKYRELGVKLQMNISSCNSLKGNLLKLLKNGKIDFLGSDAHGYGKRTYSLKDEMDSLKNSLGENKLRRIISLNGEILLKNILIETGEEVSDEEKVSSGSFFRSIFTSLFRRVRD